MHISDGPGASPSAACISVGLMMTPWGVCVNPASDLEGSGEIPSTAHLFPLQVQQSGWVDVGSERMPRDQRSDTESYTKMVRILSRSGQ